MELIWKGYLDPRNDYKTVWWRSGDFTDTRIKSPCVSVNHLKSIDLMSPLIFCIPVTKMLISNLQHGLSEVNKIFRL